MKNQEDGKIKVVKKKEKSQESEINETDRQKEIDGKTKQYMKKRELGNKEEGKKYVKNKNCSEKKINKFKKEKKKRNTKQE